MLKHWRKSLAGRHVKSTAQSDQSAAAVVTDNAAAVDAGQSVVCKLCLAECRAEQMYMLEHCRCSFCLEVTSCLHYVAQSFATIS